MANAARNAGASNTIIQADVSKNSVVTYKDGTKCELCKACLTLHINNFEPDTFLWLLEKFDVPYIEAEWNTLRDYGPITIGRDKNCTISFPHNGDEFKMVLDDDIKVHLGENTLSINQNKIFVFDENGERI